MFEYGGFSTVCEKCHFGDITVGGASVVFTSGFRFPVGHNLYRSTSSGDVLRNVYFRPERCSKVGKQCLDLSFLRVPMGLAAAVALFCYYKNNKRWGKRR